MLLIQKTSLIDIKLSGSHLLGLINSKQINIQDPPEQVGRIDCFPAQGMRS